MVNKEDLLLIEPTSIEIKMADDIFIKTIEFNHKFAMIPQHSHHYDHTSLLAAGSIRVWADEELLGDFTAPQGILIKAHTKHRFFTLTDHTLIYCIHNLHKAETAMVEELNEARPEDYEYVLKAINANTDELLRNGHEKVDAILKGDHSGWDRALSDLRNELKKEM